MGLDTVELVMEIEERFGVELPDAECAAVRTVADLAALVISRLPRSGVPCPTAHAFFELRNHIVASTRIDRRRVRPRTRITELIPSGLWRSWRALRKSNPRVPRLVATPAIDTAMVWLTGLSVLAGVGMVAVVLATHGAGAGVAAFIVVAALVLTLSVVSREIGWRLPDGVETVGDVVRLIANDGPAYGSPGERLIAQQLVLAEVRRITSEQLGLPLDKVQPESDFLKDLGAG
jgi:acyl carrier protein